MRSSSLLTESDLVGFLCAAEVKRRLPCSRLYAQGCTPRSWFGRPQFPAAFCKLCINAWDVPLRRFGALLCIHTCSIMRTAATCSVLPLILAGLEASPAFGQQEGFVCLFCLS